MKFCIMPEMTQAKKSRGQTGQDSISNKAIKSRGQSGESSKCFEFYVFYKA